MIKKLFDAETVQNDFQHYRAIPFWSWNNKLEPEELKKQIREMKEVGLGGFIMHARTGLMTEYLSEEWFECVRVCLDEAKALSMDAWMYDENGWPSGFVGGKLLENPDNLAQYVTCEDREAFDPNAFGVYVKEGKTYRRVTAPEGKKAYRAVYLHSSPANTDILNPEVVTQFIECTYEEYYKRFGARFGKEFVGFFTDEPQYYRWDTPYTRVLREYFAKEYGEELLDGLVWLFDTAPEGWSFREKYYKALNHLYTENFYKRIYDWCETHGVKLTGHSVEENNLFTQMWGGAGVMPSYEYEHVPGIDFLGRIQVSPLAGKQVGSVATQLGKSQVLTETFGCAGWDANPRELKFLGEAQFVCGVNLMCLHLQSYSLQGQGKLDHPPCFSHHATWWGKEYKEFNDYFAHLGYLLANTEEEVGTLVIHPMHSVYLRYKRWDESDVREMEQKMDALLVELSKHHIPYHFADETLLKKYGSAENGKIKLGKCTYGSVILPWCLTLDSSTKTILEEYSAQGGKLLAFDGLPAYIDGEPGSLNVTPNADWQDLAAFAPVELKIEGELMTAYRKGKDFNMLYVLNASKSQASFELPAAFGCQFDPVTAECVPVPAGRRALQPRESAVYISAAREVSADLPASGNVSEVTDAFRMVSHTPNNLTLDFVSVSKNGGAFETPKYVYQVKEELIRSDFRGNIRAKYVFTCDDVCPLTLRYERAKWISVTCNGEEVSPRTSDFDLNFLDAELPGVRKGENELVFEIDYFQSPIVRYALFDPAATESLRNCLVYDTEIESVYLRGDFALTPDLHIASAPAEVKLPRIDEQGYQMFSGETVFEGEVFFETDRATLHAEGRYMTVGVEIDGKPAGDLVLSETATLRAEAGKKHKITLRVKSSLRNTFGPFHLPDPEPLGVGPTSFTLLGEWKNGAPEIFYPGYHTVPYGIDRLTLEFH